MPFNVAMINFNYGTHIYDYIQSTYCQNNTSASDYGKCYNIACCKAIFVQSDTTTWPIDPSTGSDSFPCAKDGKCIRYTSTVPGNRTISTIFSYSNKQAILLQFWARSHASEGLGSRFTGKVYRLHLVPIPTPTGAEFAWFLPAQNFEVSSWPIYDPVSNFKAYLNPYTIPLGYVNIIRWYGSLLTTKADLVVYEGGRNNIWYAFDILLIYAYESSPLAIIPLDYDRDYVPYQELRSAFGYAATGVDQPGWNADDMVRVLKELFPNRAWAVFDDRQYMLYLYNLTPDYVPDWLIDKLSPTAMKVIKAPSDALIARAWLDKLSIRNS